jgi:hypothetical protein
MAMTWGGDQLVIIWGLFFFFFFFFFLFFFCYLEVPLEKILMCVAFTAAVVG